MFITDTAHTTAFSAFATACRHAAEEQARAGKPEGSAGACRPRWAVALASVCLSLTLLQSVATGFGASDGSSASLVAASSASSGG